MLFWCGVAGVRAGPDLSCPVPIFRFGTRTNDQGEVRAQFAITNRGDQTASITVDPMGCGCSVVALSTNAIPPGGQAQLTAGLSLRGRDGGVSRRFVVRTMGAHPRELVLGFEGIVLVPAKAFPECILFGTLRPNVSTSSSTTVRFRVGAPDAVVGIQVAGAGFTGAVATIRPRREYRIDVSTVREALASDGFYPAEVRVHTAMRGSNALVIPIRCRICSSDLEVSPEVITIPPTFDPPLTLYAMLRYRGTGTLQVLSVATPRQDVSARILPMAGNQCRIDLTGIRSPVGLSGRRFDPVQHRLCSHPGWIRYARRP